MDSSCPWPHHHAEVEERPNRIGIDTGAYRTGVLTALAIEGASAGPSIRAASATAAVAATIDLIHLVLTRRRFG